MKFIKKTIVFIALFVISFGFSQTPEYIKQNTLDYIKKAADGDHLALEGGHLALDGHVMPYPFFEAHEVLYLFRLSQLRHQTVWKANHIFYEEGWKPENAGKKSIPKTAKKISANQLNGGRLTHETYWLELPKLPKSETGWERFFCLQPIEMSLPGWPETTIYVNGKSKAALMRQHFYWSLDQLLDASKSNTICLKSFGIYDQSRGYKEISVVERNPIVDELYWYMRVLIEAKSILSEADKGYTEITALTDNVMAEFDLDISETSVFQDKLAAYLPTLRSKFKEIEDLSDSDFTLKMLNHGHLDSAWRWTLANTDEKIERLVLNNLYLMDRYPEYKYIFTTPYHYERLSELYPELFQRVKQKIKEGQWIADGSTYIETDMNLPGGESIVRQFLYGLAYYRNTLGVTNNSLFLPDTFGYPRFLPQVAQGFGLDHLVAMRVNTPEINEHIIYKWKGIDGTEILVNGLSTPAWEYPFVNAVHNYSISNPEHYTTYNAPDPGPRRLLGTYNQFKDKAATNNQLMLIGWGDGGGGGTEDQLELKRKVSHLPSFPKVEWTNMYDYITKQKQNIDKFAEFDKRIVPSRFVQRTYINANGIKTINRTIEQRLREIEVLSVLASMKGYTYPQAELKRMWKLLLVLHFHDIITGMAVPEVISEAHTSSVQLENETTDLRNMALEYLLDKTDKNSNVLQVFNPSGVTMSGVVELPNVEAKKGQQLLDGDGNQIEFSVHDSKVYIELEVFEPMTFKTFRWASGGSKNKASATLSATENSLENALVKVVFNSKGEIVSYLDKEENRELLTEKQTWNNFVALTAEGDTTKKEFAFNADASVKISDPKADGLLASLKLEILYKNSKILQEVSLSKGSKQLTFHTTIDWKEPERLEVDFPLNFTTNTANHGIQWGSNEVERSRYKATDSLKMPYCVHQWADVSDADYGVAVLDKVRYGYDLKKGGIRLILSYGQRKQSYEELKNVTYSAKGAGEIGGESFAYAILPHTGSFKAANVIQKAKAFNTPLLATSISEQHGAVNIGSLISGLPESIVLQTIKQAEDGDGIILRLYETEQKSTEVDATINSGITDVLETNLNEEKIVSLPIQNGTLHLKFKPFEIKTLRFKISK
jgi:alpha-mannosidase